MVWSNFFVNLFQKRSVDEEGLLNGHDPTKYAFNDPIRSWIIQICIIVCIANLISVCLRKIGQPKVVAEVLGGILLGPTAFGRIPGFIQHIFPLDSRSNLALVANLGLCLFLFLSGLQVNADLIKKNARLSATVALSGLILPFGLGSGIAIPLYHNFVDHSVKFIHFMLFTGTVFSITAFPVLCRILTEEKLLDSTVGIVVLSAGLGNNIVGWTLLALCVTLVKADSSLTALWVLLLCVGWILVMFFPIQMALLWLARKTDSINSGPTRIFMTVAMLVTFGSALIMDIIGVHPIFGTFLAGLIVPREGRLAIAITEKLEDMVAVIFPPLYFTISGLSTDFGSLKDGLTWGYILAITVLSFIGKFLGCSITAKLFARINWRESTAIGSFMSCKGLLGLIVLNVGLSAGILSQKVFSMFVFSDLMLMFTTLPLAKWFYPPHLRDCTSTSPPDVEDTEKIGHKNCRPTSTEGNCFSRFTIVLDKLEHLPGIVAFTQLIQPCLSIPESKSLSLSSSPRFSAPAPLSIQALRLIELSDRVSAVMKSFEPEKVALHDPLLSIFRMFGQLDNVEVTPSISIVKCEELVDSVVDHARRHNSDIILLPWLPPAQTASDAISTNPFNIIFKSACIRDDTTPAAIHSHFVHGVFENARRNVALFIDQSSVQTTMSARTHIFLPFFGGPDDRLALEFVMQICRNTAMTATIVRMRCGVDAPLAVPPTAHLGVKRTEEISASKFASYNTTLTDAVSEQSSDKTRLQSEIADSIAWARYTALQNDASRLSFESQRVEFKEFASSIPLHAAIHMANEIVSQTATRLVVVAGRSTQIALEIERDANELTSDVDKSLVLKKVLGNVATAFVTMECVAGVLVFQASTE